jgi:hypothetical protein
MPQNGSLRSAANFATFWRNLCSLKYIKATGLGLPPTGWVEREGRIDLDRPFHRFEAALKYIS